MTTCPCCGQKTDDMRHGVRLTPLKARIFDLVAHAGAQGIDADEINRIAFDGRVTRDTIKAHITQINDLLVETDFRIVGTRGGDHPRHRQHVPHGRWSWGETRGHAGERSWPYRLIRHKVKAA